ncbi:MAG TPA: universal stress protein [Rubrobacteraceae bacterium]|nr:universal stress protein [Rubrobacteraceae bacterium]
MSERGLALRRILVALETAASKARINWSFQVARGTVATEMLAAASEADLLALGKSGWTAVTEGRLGSTVRAIVSAGSGPVLILQPGARLGTPVLAVNDGSSAARKALEFAARLLPEEDGGLSVLIAANDAETARTLQKQAGEWAERRRINVRFRTLLGGRVPELVRALGTEDAGLLVLPGPFLSATAGALPAILSRIERPALLVW